MLRPDTILLIATLLPLASFGILLFAGRWLSEPRAYGGPAVAGWVATASVTGSFLCSLLTMYQWYTARPLSAIPWGWQKLPIHVYLPWLPAGTTDLGGMPTPNAGWLDLGLYIDSLTVAMFAMVTTVALLVHVFSIGYMRGDPRFGRFFAYLSLFVFSMLGLVLSATLLQLFIFWELVGFCSYLLIGFWFERKPAAQAALKAFVMNRCGDAALLVGFGLLFLLLGNASLPNLWGELGSAGRGGDLLLTSGRLVPAGLVTAIGVLLFLGAAGKSAQFPLHTWLPDAMEGPTPVSALIHAATMVTAGVYLMARLFPVLSPDCKLFIAVVGCVTIALGALAAIVQTDIKRVLAYSTISQLGYMMLAIGIGSWVGALFHLITHGFFKALLFLASGSVIDATHHEQDMRKFGGLMRRIPVTAATFLVAVFAIAGAGFDDRGLSGFHSKKNILTDAAGFAELAVAAGRSNAYWLLFAVPAVAAAATAFYMGRAWMLTFWGEPRNQSLADGATERPMMYVPLLALAALSAIAGSKLLSVRELLTASEVESKTAVRLLLQERSDTSVMRGAGFDPWVTAWPKSPVQESTPFTNSGETSETIQQDVSPAQSAHLQGERVEHAWVSLAWLPCLALTFALYYKGTGAAKFFLRSRAIRAVRRWLLEGFHLDTLYGRMFVRPAISLARFCGWFDRQVVDGMVDSIAAAVRRLSRGIGWHDQSVVDQAVVGVARSAWQLGVAARKPQSGRARLYVAALMLAIVLVSAATVLLSVIAAR